MNEIREEHLEEYVEKWKPILGIPTWKINIKFNRKHEFKDSSFLGTCDAYPEWEIADIAIIHPADYHHEKWWKYDLEFLVMHEMLHIVFISEPDKEKAPTAYRDFELGLHRIGRTLLEFDRNGNKETDGESDRQVSEDG